MKSYSEWGPWIEHDGMGCPVPQGTIVETTFEDRFGYRATIIARVTGGERSSWDWQFYPEFKRILRYRKKKPKGLEILEEMLESLDDPAKTNDRSVEKTDA